MVDLKTALARAKATNDPTNALLIKDAEAGNPTAQHYIRSRFTWSIDRKKETSTPENFADELPESTYYED